MRQPHVSLCQVAIDREVPVHFGFHTAPDWNAPLLILFCEVQQGFQRGTLLNARQFLSDGAQGNRINRRPHQKVDECSALTHLIRKAVQALRSSDCLAVASLAQLLLHQIRLGAGKPSKLRQLREGVVGRIQHNHLAGLLGQRSVAFQIGRYLLEIVVAVFCGNRFASCNRVLNLFKARVGFKTRVHLFTNRPIHFIGVLGRILARRHLDLRGCQQPHQPPST